MYGKVERIYQVYCPVCREKEVSTFRFKKDAAGAFRRKGWVVRKGQWCHQQCASQLAEKSKGAKG